jgi:CRP/FNR family cyclic AMP-dependent transcriptional regulator
LVTSAQLGTALVDKNAALELASREGWLGQMLPSFRSAVLLRAHLREFKTDDTIHLAGDEPGGMYGLLAGSIRVVLAGQEHGPYFVHLFRPVTWFGEGPAIVGQPRPVSLSAARSVTVLYLTQRAIGEIAQLDPAFWRCFVAPLMGHLDTALGATADLMIREPDKRLIAVLLRLGGCRTGAKSGPVEVDASQEDIATMANVSRSKAGSLMRKWQSMGLLALGYGRVTIHSPGGLQGLLSRGDTGAPAVA